MAKKLRSIKALKTEAWNAMSKYVRTRDKKCCSCDGPVNHAGHFQYNTERNAQLGGNELWFHIKNVHGQCIICNLYKSGNLVPYTVFMEKTYGQGIVQELYSLWRTPRKWTRQEIEEVTREYTQLLSSLTDKKM